MRLLIVRFAPEMVKRASLEPENLLSLVREVTGAKVQMVNATTAVIETGYEEDVEALKDDAWHHLLVRLDRYVKSDSEIEIIIAY